MRILLAAAAALVLPCTFASAQSASEADVARALVEQSAEVQPGDRVLITGTPDRVSLLNEIDVAVARRGAQSIIIPNDANVFAREITDAPLAALDQPSAFNVALYNTATVAIDASSDTSAALANIPEDRLAHARAANASLNDWLARTNIRSVSLGQTGGMLGDAYIHSVGGDASQLRGVFWQAVAVAPATLKARADLVSARLAPHAIVHVTRAGGTNFTFRFGDLPATVNTGRVNDVPAGRPRSVFLPAGEGYSCIDPMSANGVVVFPFALFRGAPLNNLRITLHNGAIASVASPSNVAPLRAYLTSAGGAANLSLVSFGVNPQSHMTAGSQHRSWEMSGMATFNFGSNTWAGCDYSSANTFTASLDGATVDIGGETLVNAGALQVR